MIESKAPPSPILLRVSDVARRERMHEAIETFLKDPMLAPDSRATYASALKGFKEFMGERAELYDGYARDAVQAFVDELIRRKHKPKTIALYKAAVTSLFARHGVPIGRIRTPRTSKRFLKDAVEVDEVRRMLDLWKGDRPDAVRNRAIIALLATTGIRQVEAWRANVEDVRGADGKRELLVQRKGEREKNNFVVIGKEAWEYVRAWLQAREEIFKKSAKPGGRPPLPSPALFVTCGRGGRGTRMTRIGLRKMLERSLERAGVKGNGKRVSAHSLRHAFVTTALAGGAELRKTRDAAGHRDLATTEIYEAERDRHVDAPEALVSEIVLKRD